MRLVIPILIMLGLSAIFLALAQGEIRDRVDELEASVADLANAPDDVITGIYIDEYSGDIEITRSVSPIIDYYSPALKDKGGFAPPQSDAPPKADITLGTDSLVREDGAPASRIAWRPAIGFQRKKRKGENTMKVLMALAIGAAAVFLILMLPDTTDSNQASAASEDGTLAEDVFTAASYDPETEVLTLERAVSGTLIVNPPTSVDTEWRYPDGSMETCTPGGECRMSVIVSPISPDAAWCEKPAYRDFCGNARAREAATLVSPLPVTHYGEAPDHDHPDVPPEIHGLGFPDGVVSSGSMLGRGVTSQ